MPDLVVFCVCEKVVFDKDDNNASLISLLQEITLPREALESAEGGVVAALPWTAFTHWNARPDELGKEYTQSLAVIDPKGKQLLSHDFPFNFSASSHRNRLRVAGFKVTEEGVYKIRVYLSGGGLTRKKKFGEYPLTIRLSPASPEQ